MRLNKYQKNIIILSILMTLGIYVALIQLIYLRPNVANGLNIYYLSENYSYPLIFKNFSIYEFKNLSNVIIKMTILNHGSSTVGFNYGCISPVSGRTNSSIASILNQNNVNCNLIYVKFLKPNQSINLYWPAESQRLSINGLGIFYLNLSIKFRLYNVTNCNYKCNLTNLQNEYSYSILGIQAS